MSLTLVTPPATEPVTATEAKLHLRVDHTTDDALITILIATARQMVEQITRRALITQTWDWKLDGFPACFDIPKPPLVSVTSISYVDTAGASQTWASTNYIVDAPGGPTAQPGRIAPAYGVSYPSTRSIINSVTVRFVAGYGAASAVPEPLKQAVLLLIGHLYANRESVVITGRGSIVAEMPQTVEWLCWPYRALAF